MVSLRYINKKINFKIMDQNIIIPLFGMATGIIIPIAVFIWKYYEGKGQRETMLEIVYATTTAGLRKMNCIYTMQQRYRSA